ncbi:unnamed protein product [Litomosoides sigmodontis]|uniref:SHSP domain-containing protein n=1 Tax=Litomosoides sigmodontis TaxID=42156 RepID=A0A3P6U509_LITSI|nr:unnamed protein product [Litomosoides sigmodontis]
MSRAYDSNAYHKALKGIEKDCMEWKGQKCVAQKAAHITSMPITHVARPSSNYLQIEDGLWRSERSKRPDRVMASSSGVTCHSAKLLNATNQIRNSKKTKLVAGISARPDSSQISSNIGDIINTEHGFTIQLNTKHFQPRDIQITLHQHTLSVIGDRLEDDGTGMQRLRRTFTRKYTIPSDVRLSSISSYVTNNGYLIIKGSRKGWKETDLTEHLASSSTSKEVMISAV